MTQSAEARNYEPVAPAEIPVNEHVARTAHAVAGRLQKLLPPTPSAGEERRAVPRLKFFATDSVEKFRRLGARFLGHAIENVQHVDLKE